MTPFTKPVLALAVPVIFGALSLGAGAQELQLTVGAQESGTAQWEMQVITSLGLAEKHNLDLDLRPLADSRAGQIALQSGAVDVILSDFYWVSIQRNQGNMVTMVPHSLAVGGLMTMPDSGIETVEDLSGTLIAVAGGPVDKSWLTLQAYYNATTGGDLLAEVEARYGAPPLINELLASGQANATLNYWHWNARAKAAGAVQVISVAEMLSELGIVEQPPLLGWTFTDETAEAKPDAIRAFLDASFEAKQLLLTDDAVWEDLRELMGAAEDDALFTALRDDYREGIVTRYDPSAMDAAEQTFALMTEYGGSELVGDEPTLAEGTFWEGYSRSP
jgi:NitT/TauT family transport system substrate-binding protein